MPKCLDITNWRALSKREVLNWINPPPSKPKNKGQILIVRTHLRPVDVYCYLRARFGTPNGLQNFLRRDDSDNWIHWDFNIKSGDVDVYFAGTSRDVHIMVTETLEDADWKELILLLKRDFQRVAKQKSKILHSLEKFLIFQNNYVRIANLCAGLHESILNTSKYEAVPKSSAEYESDPKGYEEKLNRISKRASKLYGDCLTLRIMTPIMAEAFINMTILILCKDSVRNDESLYQNFVRAKIPERLTSLSKNCFGFERKINKRTDAYANFMRVIQKRNFALHGNVNPLRESIEVVYFEGRRPLFNDPGHNIGKFYDHLESISRPQEVIDEYEGVHTFLLEIAECLDTKTRKFFDQVINDAYPGFEIRKRRAIRILPDHVIMGFTEGMRYDDELDVKW